MKRGRSLIIGISTLLLGVVFVLAIHGKQTMALFSDRTDGINSGKAGSVTTEVTEEIDGLAKRNIGMKNTGESACYVRMRMGFPSGPGIDGNLEITPGHETGTGRWSEGGDGYFYYNDPVEPGEKTANLYDSVRYSKVPEGVSPDQLQIVVYGEAVQSAYTADSCEDGCINRAQHAFRHLK